MTTLEFTRNGSALSLTPDGKATSTKDGSTQEGIWTAVSSAESNEITVEIKGVKTSIPVCYSFDRKAGNWNALKVEIPKDGESPATSAIFAGTIELDDAKDVTYRLPEGGAFVVCGTLFFEGTYTYLRIRLPDGSIISIGCSKPVIEDSKSGEPERSTKLSVTAFSRVGKDGKVYWAKIRVFGNLMPKKDKIAFMGSITGDRTFDITIAGTGKLANGALQITSDKGVLTFAGAVRYQFDEAEGSWGIMLGCSDKKFSLTADLDFASKKTGKEGEAKWVGKATLAHDGGTEGLEIGFELGGNITFSENRALEFKMDGQYVNGKATIALSGKVMVDHKTITAAINYADKTLSIELGYDTDMIDSYIILLKNGREVSARFYVEITIGGDGKQKVSAPKAA
jgi:hypothetical protein